MNVETRHGSLTSTVRLPLSPGPTQGHWEALQDLYIRPDALGPSARYTVTYFDETGTARRVFGGPELPGPYAFLSRQFVETDEKRTTHRVRPGDEVHLGVDRFRVTTGEQSGPELELIQTSTHTKGTTMNRGMTIGVVRSSQDFTINGISSNHDDLTVVGFIDSRQDHGRIVTPLSEDARMWEPTSARPAVAFEVRNLTGPVLSVVPVIWSDDDEAYVAGTRGMFGGNYACWSDSRVSENVAEYFGHRFYGAVAIHDRFEF